MVILTERAQKDSRTVKLIAYITMAYLPGSFVAVRLDNFGGVCVIKRMEADGFPERFQHQLRQLGLVSVEQSIELFRDHH